MGRWKNWKNRGNIVSLGHAAADTHRSVLRQIEAYWSALCPEGDVPERSAVDPRGIENGLEYAFILERIAPGVARFRIAGQHLTRLAGMEVRGMPITALLSRSARPRMAAVLEHLFDTPAIAELSLSSESRLTRKAIKGRMLLLPLKSDMGEVSRALGVLVSDADAPHTPQRLDLDDASFRPISGRILAEQEIPAPSLPESARHFAEEQTPFRPGKPNLRIVVSND